jgi:hypothetical protein
MKELVFTVVIPLPATLEAKKRISYKTFMNLLRFQCGYSDFVCNRATRHRAYDVNLLISTTYDWEQIYSLLLLGLIMGVLILDKIMQTFSCKPEGKRPLGRRRRKWGVLELS